MKCEALVDDPKVMVGLLDLIRIITPELHGTDELMERLFKLKVLRAVITLPNTPKQNLHHVENGLTTEDIFGQLSLFFSSNFIGGFPNGFRKV